MCFDRVLVVRPGNGGKKPLERALDSVEIVGENSEACAKATRSAGDAPKLTAENACGVLGISMIHKPFVELSR